MITDYTENDFLQLVGVVEEKASNRSALSQQDAGGILWALEEINRLRCVTEAMQLKISELSSIMVKAK